MPSCSETGHRSFGLMKQLGMTLARAMECSIGQRHDAHRLCLQREGNGKCSAAAVTDLILLRFNFETLQCSSPVATLLLGRCYGVARPFLWRCFPLLQHKYRFKRRSIQKNHVLYRKQRSCRADEWRNNDLSRGRIGEVGPHASGLAFFTSLIRTSCSTESCSLLERAAAAADGKIPCN